jgi:hypothetical protein
MTETINPFKALDFIRDNAEAYAQAKANLLYLTESAKESYAYAHDEYIEHLKALAMALQESERLRWLMVGAEAKIEVFRSLEASARIEMKASNI